MSSTVRVRIVPTTFTKDKDGNAYSSPAVGDRV